MVVTKASSDLHGTITVSICVRAATMDVDNATALASAIMAAVAHVKRLGAKCAELATD